ncbi:MAG: hypothetical protein LUD29_02225 [Clostridia bacterium]|nr:hypothetical protein [Clostridia bacterium]
MWSEGNLKGLMSQLPKVINDANLSRIQECIDYDKFISSYDLGEDLCGTYAPFCEGCDKTREFPCAYAYLKMIQKEGSDIRMEGENVKPTGDADFRGDGARVTRTTKPRSSTAKKPAVKK